ncbi:MAG: hypothetical protein ACJ75L_06150, partial [Gaiellaceae bacterium]
MDGASAASERLRRKLEVAEPFVGLPGRLLLEHPNAAEIYPRYLAAGYHVTCAMLELMEAALERARELDDEVSVGLVRYLERHLVEETHHEDPGGAVLDDLRALGEDPEQLVAEAALDKIASLVEAERGWIRDEHPVAILGFLELETCHTRRDTVERLIATTGLARDGFRQLLLHSRLDAVHAADLHEVLDSLPLEPHHERLVGLSALT